MNLRKGPLWVATLLCLPVLVLGLDLAWLETSGNFAPIVAGEAYRSNQPTPERLAEYNALYGIKTVLNLRGSARAGSWHDDEKAATEALGMTLIDMPLSASRELTDAEIRTLIDVLRAAEKPILIHCRSGANRTGLAAAIYLASVKHVDPAVAGRQLSLRYGHLSLPFGLGTSAMDMSWEGYIALQGLVAQSDG